MVKPAITLADTDALMAGLQDRLQAAVSPSRPTAQDLAGHLLAVCGTQGLDVSEEDALTIAQEVLAKQTQHAVVSGVATPEKQPVAWKRPEDKRHRLRLQKQHWRTKERYAFGRRHTEAWSYTLLGLAWLGVIVELVMYFHPLTPKIPLSALIFLMTMGSGILIALVGLWLRHRIDRKLFRWFRQRETRFEMAFELLDPWFITPKQASDFRDHPDLVSQLRWLLEQPCPPTLNDQQQLMMQRQAILDARSQAEQRQRILNALTPSSQ